ncbi:hypothetical protein DEO72_LG5g2635 [Vigna unguiculata]|uniref:Uncharacterized protein n=1 Tax=Vigna unguiculata TaxID=3917 RepID=A0A4D6M1W5_VIGUN|nr:hypothetical protein DEO72_LG5g2635 [Vigna unguiculata]
MFCHERDLQASREVPASRAKGLFRQAKDPETVGLLGAWRLVVKRFPQAEMLCHERVAMMLYLDQEMLCHERVAMMLYLDQEMLCHERVAMMLYLDQEMLCHERVAMMLYLDQEMLCHERVAMMLYLDQEMLCHERQHTQVTDYSIIAWRSLSAVRQNLHRPLGGTSSPPGAKLQTDPLFQGLLLGGTALCRAMQGLPWRPEGPIAWRPHLRRQTLYQ